MTLEEKWKSEIKLIPETDDMFRLGYEVGYLAACRKRQEELDILKEACKSTIPCLEDWITTTGFGEVNRRDTLALKRIKLALGLEDK